MKRYDRTEAEASTKSEAKGFEVIHPDAAGIDVGSEEMWVCVPEGRAAEGVRKFGAVTSELEAIGQWLRECGVKTVAMESTGVYWIALYQILEAAGFEVYLANARHVKNVPGRRKTDRLDCQWLQKLHACGLLRASFRPPGEICRLRSLLRHRENLVRMASRHIQHMQKALREMNVLLEKVVSDITGATGQRIIEGILSGCRDFVRMAELRDGRLKASVGEIVEALQGDYRPEHLFVLRQALEAYRFVCGQIERLDEEVERCLQKLEKEAGRTEMALPEGGLTGAEKRRGNAPRYDVQSHLYKLTGVDLTRIPGLGAMAIERLIFETGTSMDPWPTEKHFASWLGLAPDPRISGGRVIGQNRGHVCNRAAQVLRMAARSLHHSPTWLGAFYRRMKARCGGLLAIDATAHKLALIYYRMMRSGKQYRDITAADYEGRFQERMVRHLQRRAKELGFELVRHEATANA
jgi:transposase